MDYNREEYLFVISKAVRTKEELSSLIEKLNAKLNELKNKEKDVTLSVVTYNSAFGFDFNRVDAKEINEFKKSTFTSRAKKMCYYDALIAGMDAVGEALAKLDESDRPYMVTVITEEKATDNASKQYTYEDVKWICGEQKGLYNWNFETI